MSKLFNNYGRKDFEIISGQGSYLTDDSGKRYVDFTSGIGVANLGYGLHELEEVLNQQNKLLWHMPNLYQSHLQEEVAEKLIGNHDYLAFFCNSGTEANEAAIKLARKSTGRTKIISFLNSFHGRTYGSMSATGQEHIQEGYAPLVPEFVYVPYNELDGLKAALDENTAAVMMEMVQGEGGVLPAEVEWAKEVKKLCEENGTLLVVDEVQTGIGRTGTLFAFEQYDIEPDIVTLAKGLANGVPVGAMLGRSELGEAFGPGSHGSTFGGNKLAMAAANYVLDTINREEFLSQVKDKSFWLFNKLEAIRSKKVETIRGKGLMIGIVLKPEYPVADILNQLERNGLLALRAGENTLRLLPPLNISIAKLSEGLAILQQALA